MPAVAVLPQPPAVRVRPGAEAFGEEGQIVSKALKQAAAHWADRAEYLLKDLSASVDELEYDPVPLRVVGRIKIRCNFMGPLKAMPYHWDE